MNIADIIYQLALSTPVDFKTILHVKFPTSKSRQIGFTLLEQANDQHSRGDQKTIRGPHLSKSKNRKYFNRGFENSPPNSQHLSLQVTIADVYHYSALRTPVDFKTFPHVKFPISKSRQIGPGFLERVNDQHSRGDQKTIRGPHLSQSKTENISIVVLKIHRLILNIYLSR